MPQLRPDAPPGRSGHDLCDHQPDLTGGVTTKALGRKARRLPSRHAAAARACAYTAGSTLPPEHTTASVRPAQSILPDSTAASATAPPGSTTSLKYSCAAAI